MSDVASFFLSVFDITVSVFAKPSVVALIIPITFLFMMLPSFVGGYETVGEMSRCNDHAETHEMSQCMQAKMRKAQAQFGVAVAVGESVVLPYYGIK